MKAIVTIYLTGTNNLITKNNYYAGLQKDNFDSFAYNKNQKFRRYCRNLKCSISDGSGYGAGIGGSSSGGESYGSNITIDSCSVIASSKYGAGIGGSKQRAGSQYYH